MTKHITRIDKWLWFVRIFKTRTLSRSACDRGKIKINDSKVKASRKIQINDIIQVQKGIIKHLYKVKKLTDKRLAPKLVFNFFEDITPEKERIKLKSIENQPQAKRIKGKGRPTKRERRIIEKFKRDTNNY